MVKYRFWFSRSRVGSWILHIQQTLKYCAVGLWTVLWTAKFRTSCVEFLCVKHCSFIYWVLWKPSTKFLHPYASSAFWAQSAYLPIIRTSLLAQTVKRLPTMWETSVQSLGREDPLEKEMVTHSSILAWEIPWMEEPGGLQFMGSQRVGHDWATSLTHSLTHSLTQSSLTILPHNHLVPLQILLCLSVVVFSYLVCFLIYLLSSLRARTTSCSCISSSTLLVSCCTLDTNE